MLFHNLFFNFSNLANCIIDDQEVIFNFIFSSTSEEPNNVFKYGPWMHRNSLVNWN